MTEDERSNPCMCGVECPHVARMPHDYERVCLYPKKNTDTIGYEHFPYISDVDCPMIRVVRI